MFAKIQNGVCKYCHSSEKSSNFSRRKKRTPSQTPSKTGADRRLSVTPPQSPHVRGPDRGSQSQNSPQTFGSANADRGSDDTRLRVLSNEPDRGYRAESEVPFQVI